MSKQMEEKKYPECEKLSINRPQIVFLKDFFEWLREQDGVDIDCPMSDELLIRKFFDIDEDKLEKERREIIDSFSAKHDNKVQE